MIKYKYIVVENHNGKTFYLARQQVGMPTYKVVAHFTTAALAKVAASALNKDSVS
jgi:hypothetical protein